MSKVGKLESETQKRIINLFANKLGYTYIGNLSEFDNHNIKEELLKNNLAKRGYSEELIRRSINLLISATKNDNLYSANEEVYSLLRYGKSTKIDISEKYETVKFIDWKNFDQNDFYIAEEVTVKGEHDKRPDIVLYINGIAICVLELKRSSVSVLNGIRQNLDNQRDMFIKSFFNTIQLTLAGNDTEGLRYGTIQTPDKFYIEWKEDGKAEDLVSQNIRELQESEEYRIDKSLISLCQKDRLLDIIYNFIAFDSGRKKICRHNQYFGVVAARARIKKQESGIIWHTQGSGKSLTMVWLSRWIKESNPNARILIITDRDELDNQIESDFIGVNDSIYRTKNCKDLIEKLNANSPITMCSLVHKFGNRVDNDDLSYDEYIAELRRNLPLNFSAKGEFYVFVDECHRTQSGKLHKAMKEILPTAMFIGFTGTPLLSSKAMRKLNMKSSIEVFGTYIHTYKYTEGVADNIVLDLRYEARDVEQKITSQKKIDEWFEVKTRGLTDLAKAQLKRRWGTLKEVYSSEGRLGKIVVDIVHDMETKDRLVSNKGNAMLVAESIYEACKYYKLFQDSGFKKCAIVTSFNGDYSSIKGEATGNSRETENFYKYEVYQKMLEGKKADLFEEEAKNTFVNKPDQLKLLIVVDKLLTGFDAPSATYLYIDKSMKDHGLFQAICRVNRLDSEDKEYGYIVDYKDLFKSLEKAVANYTSEAFDNFEVNDVDGLLKNRVTEAKNNLEKILQSLRTLCEPVEQPKGTLQYLHYFCWKNNENNVEELEANKSKRLTLYQMTASLLRTFSDVSGNMEDLGYTVAKVNEIRNEVKYYQIIRDEVKIASEDYIDLKSYEADMRHLIDKYIDAEESTTLSAFDDFTLIDLIVERGVEFIDNLPEGIRKDKTASAEVIENNVRRKIVEKQMANPKYYEKMSELLEKIIEERKKKVIDYKEYLQKVVELTRRIVKPEEYSGYPSKIKKSFAMRALYDNIRQDEDFVIMIHEKILAIKPDNFLGDKAKENTIIRELRSIVGSETEAERIFEIVKKQKEYLI